MRLHRIVPFALTLTLAACGGGEPPETAEAEAAPEATAAAPATTVCWLSGASLAEAKGRPSPLMETPFSVGGHDGTLCYGAPAANGRQVMGALVPYGEIWRLGANEPTTLHLTGPAQVGGVTLEPGSYSLYAVPGETEWTFYINSSYQRWGIPIGDDVRATEVGSFTAPVEATDGMVERLGIRFVPSEDGTMGDMFVEWENTRVTFHLHPAG
ncbi:MAG: hypothetical protein AMXMBFR53_37420 [Gemmatimonadota bacterium]